MAGRVSSDWGSNTMASSQMFYFLLVPLFVLWLIYFKLSRRNLNKHAANIPGPPGYPIIGNLFDLMGSSHSEYYAIFIMLFAFAASVSIINSSVFGFHKMSHLNFNRINKNKNDKGRRKRKIKSKCMCNAWALKQVVRESAERDIERTKELYLMAEFLCSLCSFYLRKE